MTLLTSTLRRRPLALTLVLTSFVAVAIAGVAIVEATQRTPLAPGLEGVLTYVVEDGSYVAIEAGYPDTQVDVPGAVAETSDEGVPANITSPDGRYVAAIRFDDDGTHLDITNNDRLVRSYWIASPTDPAVVLGPKDPARALEGVPLAVAWSPDSESLAFGSLSGAPWSLVVASVGSWTPNWYQVRGGYVGELAWAPDSSQLAISTYEIDRSDHNVLMFDVATRTVRDLIDGCSIVWAPNGQFLAVHREPAVDTGVWMTSSDGLTRFEATDDPMAFPVSWIEAAS